MSDLVERLRTASSLAQALPACREAADRLEQLEAAIDSVRSEIGAGMGWGAWTEEEYAMMERVVGMIKARAALAQSSPSPLQAPHNPGERLRNSDVAAGEGGTPPVESAPPSFDGTTYGDAELVDYGSMPARQENDDVFPGFRGNNEA